MSEQKLLQEPAIIKFLAQNQPKQRKSKLEPFKEHILFLKEQGYSDKQIVAFLKTEKQFSVTQQAVNKFIRSRGKEITLRKNTPKSSIEKSKMNAQTKQSNDKFVIDDVPLSDLI